MSRLPLQDTARQGIRQVDCVIKSDCPGRLRVQIPRGRMDIREADALEYSLLKIKGVRCADVHERTGSVTVLYTKNRALVVEALALWHGADEQMLGEMPQTDNRLINRTYQDRACWMVVIKLARDLLLPMPLRVAWTVGSAIRFVIRGLRSLRAKRLRVEALDAISVTVSVLRHDFATAGNIMFLLDLGDLLGEWTKRKSISDLAKSMSLNIDKVWLKGECGEVLVPVSRVAEGDIICVRQGNLIPLDGVVVSGEAMVNQASMTGESMPVRKSDGTAVYAGTAVEEGSCEIKVIKAFGKGRYDRIVHMIEESEKMKSVTEMRALNMADSLVPYSLGATGLVWLLTRNAVKAVSVLMVDYSCALKLCMPLSVLSAMRECGKNQIIVKGGKYLEAVAEADTIVFDKTGTLTEASPRVAKVVPFGTWTEIECLRVAACLEEHFPHSVANAVVREAQNRKIRHDEMHSEIKYIVAHGVASHINGKKAVIGSYHFVFEDESCTVPNGQEKRLDSIDPQYSHLYMAIDGELAAVICICDPLRTETRQAIRDLRALGIRRVVMMTGDSERTAASIASQAGVDMYYSEVLPEDKAYFVRSEKKKGHTVIMIGDGINDSPALSEADAGIAVSDGAAIARQIADITIQTDNLRLLVYLREVAIALKSRINFNYRFVMSFNTVLIVLGIMGVLSPSSSALFHNLSTFAISLRSLTELVGERHEFSDIISE